MLGLAVGGGVVATNAASASPWNPNVDVTGRVLACPPHTVALRVHFWANTGDPFPGWVPVQHGQYTIHLHHVQPFPKGEPIAVTVDCTGNQIPHPPAFTVQRPWRGFVFRHDLR